MKIEIAAVRLDAINIDHVTLAVRWADGTETRRDLRVEDVMRICVRLGGGPPKAGVDVHDADPPG